MESKLYQDYLHILKKELVPALGCTEPIALAYAAAKCRENAGRGFRKRWRHCAAGTLSKMSRE